MNRAPSRSTRPRHTQNRHRKPRVGAFPSADFAKGRRRRWAAAGAIALAIAALATSCYYGPDPNLTLTQIAQRGQEQKLLPWFCHSSGLGGAMENHHHGGLANDVYADQTKGDLSWDDCTALAAMLDRTLAATKQWPTRGDAKRDGFVEGVLFVPGLGTHDYKPGWSMPGLDPEHPLFLQYDGPGDDARLAGFSWIQQTGTTPPAGFPGGNDWWHQHLRLCGGTNVALGEGWTDEQCRAAGGTPSTNPDSWMIHAWIAPGYEDLEDVFAGSYQCLRGVGPLPATDRCHAPDFTLEELFAPWTHLFSTTTTTTTTTASHSH